MSLNAARFSPHSTAAADLDDNQRERLIDAMEERPVSAGGVVITQGGEGDFFYVVESGRFAAKKGDAVKFVYDGSGEWP